MRSVEISIDDVLVRYVFNSRGLPTVEAELLLYSSSHKYFRAQAAAPLGASCGGYEQSILKKENMGDIFAQIKSVIAWANRSLVANLIGLKLPDVFALDRFLLGMPELKRNVWYVALMVSISIAGYRAYGLAREYQHFAAWTQERALEIGQTNNLRQMKYKMPRPLFNMINGGLHADIGGSVQEFLLMPVSSASFAQSMEMGALIGEKLYGILKKQGQILGVGDEGGWAVTEKYPERILDILSQAIDKANYSAGRDVILGMDIAASVFYDKGSYYFNDRKLLSRDMIVWYSKIVDCYPVALLEDPLSYDDLLSWEELYSALAGRVWVVGDDLFATQVEHLQNLFAKGVANAVIAKPNQAGTVWQLAKFCHLAHENGLPVIMSHRSGETEDSYLADLAVDFECQVIKSGGLARSERLAKYNQLMRIEEQLISSRQYDGMHNFRMKK